MYSTFSKLVVGSCQAAGGGRGELLISRYSYRQTFQLLEVKFRETVQ
jgi:hypothetical protein